MRGLIARLRAVDGHAGMPWRGPGDGRPGLPLPPGPMPLFSRAILCKRWRYVGFFGEEIMFCAAQVAIGPFSSCFWSLWDREEGRLLEHTQIRPGHPEVVIDGNRLELRSDTISASLLLGESEPVEVVCPSGRGWGWTRKRAGVPITGSIRSGDRAWQIDGTGVDDHSAGYHARHTRWSWSAGVGVAADGRSLAWNLVSGINDPLENSERAIWVDGDPIEPEPVVFLGLDAVRSLDGGQLDFDFSDGAERRRHDNFGLIRSDYVHRFGTFTGSLAGIELERGVGVMEEHAAVW